MLDGFIIFVFFIVNDLASSLSALSAYLSHKINIDKSTECKLFTLCIRQKLTAT